MECAILASEALADDLGVLVHKNSWLVSLKKSDQALRSVDWHDMQVTIWQVHDMILEASAS